MRLDRWINRGPASFPDRPISELAVRELRRFVREHPAGDALIFMPGTYEIARTLGGPSTLAARIQDLYGVNDVLWIANRRVRVRIQILAPDNRPVQMTENLGDFWRDTYPKLKQQLQRRYPKHEWR